MDKRSQSQQAHDKLWGAEKQRGDETVMKTETNTRTRILWGTLLLVLVAFPLPSRAEVHVGINFALPPIVFGGPPELIVLPGTNIYVVPDVEADIFFYNGWWWRPWEGRWSRSRSYDSGWYRYRYAPPFYRHVPRHWRRDYRAHRWQGRRWDFERMPHHQVEKNWRGWEKSRHWERQQGRQFRNVSPRTRPDRRSREIQRPQSRQQFNEVRRNRSQRPSREVQRPKPRQQVNQMRQDRPQRQQRSVQPGKSRPQSREVQRNQGQRHRGAAPQTQRADTQKHSNKQDRHKRGERE